MANTAPVYTLHTLGKGLAALSLAGPITRFRDDHLEELQRSIRRAAEEVSLKLGRVPESHLPALVVERRRPCR